jgi:alcohol dehydrogenase YqhD (iron-dependent ADH family)
MTFNYYLPVNVVFGAGKVKEAGVLTKPYGKKALIVTGKSSAKKSGLYDTESADDNSGGRGSFCKRK